MKTALPQSLPADSHKSFNANESVAKPCKAGQFQTAARQLATTSQKPGIKVVLVDGSRAEKAILRRCLSQCPKMRSVGDFESSVEAFRSIQSLGMKGASLDMFIQGISDAACALELLASLKGLKVVNDNYSSPPRCLKLKCYQVLSMFLERFGRGPQRG
jgi:hypothetical protein